MRSFFQFRAGFGVLIMVSQMGSQMSVSEADQEWSEWSVRFEQLLVTGWSVSHTTEWHTDSGQILLKLSQSVN